LRERRERQEKERREQEKKQVFANAKKPGRPISATYNLTSNLKAEPKAVYGQYQA
jgi:hypothetical protein